MESEKTFVFEFQDDWVLDTSLTTSVGDDDTQVREVPLLDDICRISIYIYLGITWYNVLSALHV